MNSPAQGELLLPDLWLKLKSEIERTLPSATFLSWISECELLAIDDERLLIGTDHSSTEWMTARFGPLITNTLEALIGKRLRVSFSEINRSRIDHSCSEPNDQALYISSDFNPKYSFENFIIGESNHLAHAATLAVAEAPAQTYNPLFIYGPPGSGKTHLLHAIGNYLSRHMPDCRVTYTTTEAFTNGFVKSIQNGDLGSFKSKFRNSDVLLIDDIQFLQRKAKTEEEFFHTFNALQETGKQIVLTCDRVPRHLEAFQERLLERFESGLVADILRPDIGTKLTVLRKIVRQENIQIDDQDVLYEIARRAGDNIRTLEGALIRVVAYHSLTKRPLNKELVTEVLNSLYPQQKQQTQRSEDISIDRVKQAVCEYFQLEHDQLISKSRSAKLNWPRQVAIYLARELVGSSLVEIGASFGGRSHNTALHSYRKTKEKIAVDIKAQSAVDNLIEKLRT